MRKRDIEEALRLFMISFEQLISMQLVFLAHIIDPTALKPNFPFLFPHYPSIALTRDSRDTKDLKACGKFCMEYINQSICGHDMMILKVIVCLNNPEKVEYG
jgi:hypothetical protein